MADAPSKAQPRRQPKQARSRALVDAIHQACMQLIEEDKGDKLNVSLIAKTAGITLSSFYQYFSNVQSVVASTLLKYDQNHEHPISLERKLAGQTLTSQQAIEFLVDSTCDRHLRFLKKYGQLYRQYHRFVNAELCVGFDEEGLAKLVTWEIWLRSFLQEYCESNQPPPSEISIFIATTIFVELTGKAVEEKPHILADGVFRRLLVNLVSAKII